MDQRDWTDLDANATRPEDWRELESAPKTIIGSVIDGRYEVKSQIGAGGMGFVYLAYHLRMQRDVVLKTLRPELVESERTRERFIREAQSSTRVQHPHVIKVHDYGVHEEYGAYYVMEHLDGCDLAQAMHQVGRPFQLDRALHITRQVASALGSAHAANVVHRDLKPENIFLITQNGEADYVKVLDFGLARLMDANRRLTETGQVIGTPRFMAPEQCKGEKVDARADVYSLALILYQMVTGEQPYRELSTYEILGKKMFEDIPPPSKLKPPRALPPAVETLLVRCLDRDPARRPPDGAHFGEAVRQVVDELGLDPGPFAPRSSVPNLDPWPKSPPSGAHMLGKPRSAKTKNGRRGLLVGMGVAVLVMALGVPAIWFGLSWFQSRDQAQAAPELITPGPEQEPSERGADDSAEEIEVDPIWVTVSSVPAGAEVWSGERLLGVTPLAIRRDEELEDGTPVEVRLEGFETRQLSLFSDVPSPRVLLHAQNPDEVEE